MRRALLALGVLVFAAACTGAGDPEGGVVTTTQSTPSTTAAGVDPGDVTSQGQAIVDSIRSRDSDDVWAGVTDREIIELAAGFCRIADQVADLSRQAFSGVDPGNRGQYFMGSIIPQGASPTDLRRTGAMVAALVSVNPTTCSESALTVLTEGLDWAVATVG